MDLSYWKFDVFLLHWTRDFDNDNTPKVQQAPLGGGGHALPVHAGHALAEDAVVGTVPEVLCCKTQKKKGRIQHHAVPGWSPTPVLSGLKPR